MLIKWLPSKKAIAAGLPDGFDPSIFDLDTATMPESSRDIMVKRTYFHMLNNEGASAWLAEKDRRTAKAAKDGTEPDTGNETRIAYVQDWRLAKVAEVREGRLGMREPAEVIFIDPVEKEAKQLAFERVRNHVLKQGGTFPYTVLNAKSMAFDVDGKGGTVGTYMDRILDRNRPQGAKLWAEAEENVKKRQDSIEGADDSDVFEDAAE